MLGQIREKLCCCCKGDVYDDDVEENFILVSLSQRGNSRLEVAHFDQRAASDTRQVNRKPVKSKADAQDSNQQEDENDEADGDVSPITNRKAKKSSLEEDRKSDSPELRLDQTNEEHKQNEPKTPEHPVPKTRFVEKNDKSNNADLWQQVFDELDEDLKAQLREKGKAMLSLENAIKEVLEKIKGSYEAY